MAKFSPAWRAYVRKLQELRQSLAPALRPAMNQAAQVVVDMQRHLVPIDLGDLRDSISYSVGGESGTRVTITAGGSMAPYAPFVEFGTSSMRKQPFFFPGWRAAKGKARRIVNKAIRDAVRKAMT